MNDVALPKMKAAIDDLLHQIPNLWLFNPFAGLQILHHGLG